MRLTGQEIDNRGCKFFNDHSFCSDGYIIASMFCDDQGIVNAQLHLGSEVKNFVDITDMSFEIICNNFCDDENCKYRNEN